MIAIFNSLFVKEGADRVVERFRESRGYIQGLPGFVSIEVLVGRGRRRGARHHAVAEPRGLRRVGAQRGVVYTVCTNGAQTHAYDREMSGDALLAQ